MKKLFSILLAFAMLLALAGCGEKPAAPAPDASAPQAGQTDVIENGSPAEVLMAAFNSISDKSAEEIANELAVNEVLPFEGVVMPVEPGYLNGFTEEVTGFAEGYTFAPMIGSIPFVGYVFQLEDGADAAAFVKTLTDLHDLRWNICTQADQMICEAGENNNVFFVMSPANFDE